MLEERKRYLDALAQEGDIRLAVMEVERRVVHAMQGRGYPAMMIQSALVTESRYKLLFAEDGEEKFFFEELLRDASTASPADAMSLPPPASAFNELYAKTAQPLCEQLADMDQRVLQHFCDQGCAASDIRTAYLGGSLYGDIVAGKEERMAYEAPIWNRHQEARHAWTLQQIGERRREHLDDGAAWNDLPDDELYANFLQTLAEKRGRGQPVYEDERSVVSLLSDARFRDRFPEERVRSLLDHLSPSCTKPGCQEMDVIEALIAGRAEPPQMETSRTPSVEANRADDFASHPEVPQKLWDGRRQIADEKELERRKHLPSNLTRKEQRALQEQRNAYVFQEASVQSRGTMRADAFYDACRDEIDAAIPLPHDMRMDETIVLYMFAVGYEEREIEDALATRSPMRFRQKSYGKGLPKKIAGRTDRGKVQAIVAQSEYKYLQNKEERKESLTSYEKERILVRDVV